MDIDIVNTILRLCIEQQTCLFEIPFLCNYCLEQRLCTNSKYVLASIRNYLKIFQISRDQSRIEFFMPFEICRNHSFNGICSNIHLCYDYFDSNSCGRLTNCPYPHLITRKHHEEILGPLVNLNLDLLTKAFRVYCQLKKYLLNHNSSEGQQPSLSVINNPTPSSSLTNNGRLIASLQINGNSSWKTNNPPLITSRILPRQLATVPLITEKGLQIRWEPRKDIQTHFIEVVFSNQSKSAGGPIQTHNIYQHLGIAQVFYQNSDIVDRVVLHGPVIFQSFTFTPRLLCPTVDVRHVCFSNIPIATNHISSYVDVISIPYTKTNFEYYQNDQQTIIVEYNEDIDFAKIASNVRNHPECNGSMITCVRLYRPETLFVEYDQEYSEDDIRTLFDEMTIFHVKTYPYCSFVHFYSHEDLVQSLNKTFDDSIQLTPIYVNIYSQKYLNDYLQRRQMELQTKSTSSLKETIENQLNTSVQKNHSSSELQPSIPILSPPPPPPPKVSPEQKSSVEEEIRSPSPSELTITTSSILEEELVVNTADDEPLESEDDFHDLPSEFDDEEFLLEETIDNSGDTEFLRNAAKNLMSSLAEMEAASSTTSTVDAPRSLLYGDDYVVTIKSRRFAVAFLDYTQFRVEKQSNPDKYRLMTSLRQLTKKKKRADNAQQREQTSSAVETQTSKKKRNKRNKKKTNGNNNNHQHIDKDDEIHVAIK